MKNLMRIMSVLILFVAIIVTVTTIFDMGMDFNVFAAKITIIFVTNIMSFISLAACAYCLERNDSNYLTRIIPIYVTIPIILTTALVFFNINDEFMAKLLVFLIISSMSISLFSITMIIKPNNQITSIIKIISIISIAVCCVLNVIDIFGNSSLKSIAGLNSSSNLNFLTSQSNFDNITDLIKNVASIVELFSIMLLFTTNYAFSSSVELEDDDIDYEAVKKDAMATMNKQMNERYNLNPKEEAPDRSQSNNGLMNVSNQLGVQSNVGNVKEKAKDINVEESLDAVMSFSSGPVVNNTVNSNESETKETQNENLNNQNNSNVETNQQQIDNQNKTAVNNPVPQNVDIQSVMQQNTQAQNNINPQQIQQNQNVQQQNSNQIQNPFLNNNNTNNNSQNKFIN